MIKPQELIEMADELDAKLGGTACSLTSFQCSWVMRMVASELTRLNRIEREYNSLVRLHSIAEHDVAP